MPLYNRFVDKSVEFTHFMLFAGVAFSITTFPVLCRILMELKLLDTTVGIVVLSARVGNNIVGSCLWYASPNCRAILLNSLLTVLHTFWSLDRSRSTSLWSHLGVHDRHLHHGLHWKIRWMLRPLAACFAGCSWRESTTIGTLMSCKG